MKADNLIIDGRHLLGVYLPAMIKGQKHSEETKRRLSAAHRAAFASGARKTSKGRKRPDLAERNKSPKTERQLAAAQRMIASNRGRALPPEHRARIAEALRRHVKTPEHRARLSLSMSTDEARARNARQMVDTLLAHPKRTKPEVAMATYLARRGVVFIEQFQVGASKRLFDFAVPARRLLIEVDGCYWHGCESCGEKGIKNSQGVDAKKDEIAKANGWKLVRVRTCQMRRL